MSHISNEKFKNLLRFIKKKGINALLIVDFKDVVKDPTLKFLSGHPKDAALILENSGQMTLFPIDLSLAKKHSKVDSIADLRPINNNWKRAIQEFFKERYPRKKPLVGLNDSISADLYQEITSFPEVRIYDNPKELTDYLNSLRTT